MPDPDQYAAEQAAALRDDWQFSRIFAGEPAQRGFTALLALRAELLHVAGRSGEPGIAALKFEWWRGEIERGFAGSAQHPVARALGVHVGKAGAPEYCIEMVDAAETESETDTAFTDADFLLYRQRSGGVLAEQLALLSGVHDRNTLDAARRLGQLKRFSDMLLSIGAMLRAGRWLFPAAWLPESVPAPGMLHGKHDDPATRTWLVPMLDALDRERVETRTAMEHAELPPALRLQWRLAQRDYAAMRARPQIMLEAAPAKGNALARLWVAWRGARDAARR